MTNSLIEPKTVRRYKSLGFYSPHETSRIAQVPIWTITSWKNKGVIVPTTKWVDELGKEHFGYTFETVVYFRLIRMLKDKGISLFEAVTAVKKIKVRFGNPGKRWGDAKIFTDGKEVYVYDENDKFGTTDVTKSHQKVAELIYGDDFLRLRDRADALLIPLQYMDSVEIDPSIQNGLPIIFGTTILTKTIHNLKIQGYSYSDICEMYPFLETEKIMGAEEYELYLDKASSN